ncbi:hypothetical protein Ddc_23704 [Ditylenchus destructor]|nr:hypothetical protein Ddc_23704 [Ditylenchus destructor]
MQRKTFLSASHPFRNRFGLLEPGIERHQNEVGKVQGKGQLRQQRTLWSRRQDTQYTQDHERNAEHPQPDLALPALVAHGFDRAASSQGNTNSTAMAAPMAITP